MAHTKIDTKDILDYMISNLNEKQIKTFKLEVVIDFREKCKTVQTGEEIMALVDDYVKLFRSTFMIKEPFNKYIGWALPSREACTIIVDVWQKHLQKYPSARLIDVGAGSGVFCHVFHDLGIPEDRLVAIDLKIPTHRRSRREFWPIQLYDDYEFKPEVEDILFVAWGCLDLDKYLESGVKCVILLGEGNGGCTFPADYFITDEDEYKEKSENEWTVTTYGVPAAAKFTKEMLSINIRN